MLLTKVTSEMAGSAADAWEQFKIATQNRESRSGTISR